MYNERDHLLVLLCKYTAHEKLTRRQRKWLHGHRHLLDFSIREDYLLELAEAQRETEASLQRFKSKSGAIATPDTLTVRAGGPVIVRRLAYLLGSAALVAVGLWVYSLIKHQPGTQHTVVVATAAKEDIGPGGFKATLKLGDGSEIVLDPNQTGIIATQDNIQINQSTKGRLVYQTKAVTDTPHVVTNELTTPRAGKYQVVLPDRSLVLLNAASSLRYTSALTGNDRTVELSGEGWFEVAKDKQKPFRIKMKGVTIEVLGTYFNVHAYDDEVNKTTLISGNIRVKTNTGHWVTVKPNQQAWLDSKQQLKITAAGPDEIRQAIAWKTDSIYFENASVKEIMQQLERWYDAKIIDSASVGNKQVMLKPLSRNENISTILNILKNTRVLNYGIKGRTVTLLAP